MVVFVFGIENGEHILLNSPALYAIRCTYRYSYKHEYNIMCDNIKNVIIIIIIWL